MQQKMKLIRFSFLLILMASLNSCAFMFNETVFPNQCMECRVVDRSTSEVLWSEKGCGGDKTRMKERAKVEAYDLSRYGRNLCDLEVVCDTWRKDPEEEFDDN